MSNTILFVFEGEVLEKQIFDNIKKNFFSKEKSTMLIASFKAEIYQLYRQVKDDEFLDIVELLKEKNPSLAEVNREDVSQIYMFFDYDGHASNASDIIVNDMLEFFNEETDQGKLYISYPMAEAIKDFDKTRSCCYERCLIHARKNIKYKEIVAMNSSFKNIKKISSEDWNFIFQNTVKKAHCIVFDKFIYPEYKIFQKLIQPSIFENQDVKFIEPYEKVAVLSAFPLFILEYFGEKMYSATAD